MIKQTYNAPIDTEMNERQEKPITPNFDCVTANYVKSTTAPCYYGIDPFKTFPVMRNTQSMTLSPIK